MICLARTLDASLRNDYPWISITSQIIAAAADVEQKKEIYVPYNVLPLDAAGSSQAIMQLDEVRIFQLEHCS